MGAGMNVFVHIENAAILPNVKSPAVRESCRTQHAVRPCNPFIRIAENGIVEPERLRESVVGLGRIYTHAEAFGFETPEHAVARTERFALARSPGRESFGEPGEHNGVCAPEIAKTVPATIGPDQLEVRRDISRFEFDAIPGVAG
jgi:hypothetical protein